MSWAGACVWHQETGLCPGEQIWSVSWSWPRPHHTLPSYSRHLTSDNWRTQRGGWQQYSSHFVRHKYLLWREEKWKRWLHLNLLSRPGISMSSVTPIKTGIKRYKIHEQRHFLIPIEFHIQFWIALWSTQQQYSECYLKCLFRTLSHWTSQVITAAALPRSRL